ncbi:unnamed protein product [Cuscuta epithymum]|uniref:Uncharacterized protein n=1 Tax=Cuscuta epithymum TaxID=186058 RepID=A0AAV0G0B7_9ASTE|nr:unnamed protein product [Cuscuta epithymum]
MGSFSEDEGECQFYDAPESISQTPDSGHACLESTSNTYEYDFWVRSPTSIRERRRKFLKWIDFPLDRVPSERNSISKDESSLSEFQKECKSVRSLAEYLMPMNGQYEEFENHLTVSPTVEEHSGQRESLVVDNKLQTALKRAKSRCLSRLRSFTLMNSEGKADNLKLSSSSHTHRTRVHKVKVRHFKKRSKELSGLFMGQDIPAHNGSILTMKFSLDGQFLASGGEDKILQVWQVVEDKRSNVFDIPDLDPSCLYLYMNHLSQVTPSAKVKEKIHKFMSISKTAESACVVFPPKVLRIHEKPLHKFQGHCAEVLDLSWSKNNFLLSCSIDKTARLWKVGSDQCLRVFSHSNYVTCVQFNPVNDGYFISGSIDGKTRIWDTNGGQVVDWTEIKDIVTAVSYHPSGQGGIIGSLTGSCHFFNVTENHIQLEPQHCMVSKKKSADKRITAIQFVPRDPSKVMVTCADSQVRILSGMNVIGKYKGPRNAGNFISASFTSDGKHIVTAADDFNVYLWNYISPEESSLSKKKVVKSHEFFSGDASVALPWSGLKFSDPLDSDWKKYEQGEKLCRPLPFSFSSLGSEPFMEGIPKCSATWPEEKLLISSHHCKLSSLSKSQYKFLKSSYQISSFSHAWSLVLVTAGWDGQIRSFHNYGLPVQL